MVFFRRSKDADPRERALWGQLLSLGMVFPAAIALGFFIGKWTGAKLGYPRAGIWIGLIWGAATGFWELYKVTVRLDRMDKAQAEEEKQHGKDGDGGN